VPEWKRALYTHLWFSLPAAILMPFMLVSGLKRRRAIHLSIACVFGVFWIGTFVTGIFFLPAYP
jgi:hypothetical protein